MAAAAPTVQEMFQQLLNANRVTMDSIQDLTNRSMDTNSRLDEMLKRVVDIEVAQSLAVYNHVPEDTDTYTDAPRYVDWKTFKLLELPASALF